MGHCSFFLPKSSSHSRFVKTMDRDLHLVQVCPLHVSLQDHLPAVWLSQVLHRDAPTLRISAQSGQLLKHCSFSAFFFSPHACHGCPRAPCTLGTCTKILSG